LIILIILGEKYKLWSTGAGKAKYFCYEVGPTLRKSKTWALLCLGSLLSRGSKMSGWGRDTP
jgi:hypothetical protein